MAVKSQDSTTTAWVQIPVLSFINSVTLDKFLGPFEPQFPLLPNMHDNYSTYNTGILGRQKGLVYLKAHDEPAHAKYPVTSLNY